MDHVDNPFKSPSILSLCPGIRGLERGIERAIGRINVIAYVEIEAFIITNLVAAMEKGFLAPAPIWSDIKTFNAKPFRNKVHGIIGGYPCQPFSNAGARNGTSDPRHLYPFISGIIKATGSVWCFFENVAGHLTLGYPEVSADLRSMGYAVEAGIYSAEEVGAPHQRDRLFILAIKSEWLANTINERCFMGWSRGDEMDVHARNENQRSEVKEFCGIRGEQEMGNPTSERQQESRSRLLSELPAKEGTGVHDRPEQPSNGEVAYAYGGGSGKDRQQGELRATSIVQPPGNSGITTEGENSQRGRNRWPARPGEQQYDWEEPRTIKSGMGSTVDGYNFREDLLRAYGNSVVEQTAEIAMIDLLKKHGLG